MGGGGGRERDIWYLGEATVVLLGFHHLTAVVLQVEEDDHLAYPEILHCALSDSLLEVAIPPQHLHRQTETSSGKPICCCQSDAFSVMHKGVAP